LNNKLNIFLSLLFFICANKLKSQAFLNGNFENTSTAIDQINISNAAFNGFMANTFAFGPSGNMDIIQSNTYCGFRQSGCFYIGFTGLANDAIAMQLSAPLVSGTTYSICFWEKACTPFSCGPLPMELGLSTVNNAFGTLIFTSPLSISGVWSQRTFTFSAPNNGSYITVRMNAGTGCNWVQMDNFSFAPFTTSVACSPLPIELTSFAAETENNSVRINWNTASETNNDFFTIERSKDGISFEELKNIDAAGNSKTNLNYTDYDRMPFEGISYYRLKQTDFDHSISYSQIKAVMFDEKVIGLQIYPNPSKGSLTLDTKEPVNLNGLKMINVLGEEVNFKTEMLNDFSLQISNLSSGVYFLVYVNGIMQTTQKVVVELVD